MLYADVSKFDFDTVSWTWDSEGELPPSNLREVGGPKKLFS